MKSSLVASVQEYSLHFWLLFNTVDSYGTDFTKVILGKWYRRNWVRLGKNWVGLGKLREHVDELRRTEYV